MHITMGFLIVLFARWQVIAKDLSHSDLCWTLNKQRVEGRIASARCTNAGTRPHSSFFLLSYLPASAQHGRSQESPDPLPPAHTPSPK